MVPPQFCVYVLNNKKCHVICVIASLIIFKTWILITLSLCLFVLSLSLSLSLHSFCQQITNEQAQSLIKGKINLTQINQPEYMLNRL